MKIATDASHAASQPELSNAISKQLRKQIADGKTAHQTAHTAYTQTDTARLTEL